MIREVKPMTKKQQIIDYVALNDGATYTEIIKFIMKLNFGQDYDYHWQSDRGYYSCAFWKSGYKTGHLISPGKFDEYLTKIGKKWFAVRQGKIINSQNPCTGPNCC